MIYWIENAQTGSFIESAKSYEQALKIQNRKWKEEGIDTYIIKDE